MKILLITLLIFISSLTYAQATKFKIGDTILIAYPANNIKDDSYLIGIVRYITVTGDYRLAITDFVEGHDYGLACVPIVIDSRGAPTTQSGWEVWTDTTNPIHERLEFIVPADRAMKLSSGKMLFIERYNIYIVFSRWLSNVPILAIDKLKMTQRDARAINMAEINPAFDIAILDRLSFYKAENGVPLWPYQSIEPLTTLLSHIQKTLNEDPKLNTLWQAKKRDWDTIEQSMQSYFLIRAIDKAITNASHILYEDGLEKADPKYLTKLKKQLNYLAL